jgi:hypothetical protein
MEDLDVSGVSSSSWFSRYWPSPYFSGERPYRPSNPFDVTWIDDLSGYSSALKSPRISDKNIYGGAHFECSENTLYSFDILVSYIRVVIPSLYNMQLFLQGRFDSFATMFWAVSSLLSALI